MATQKVTIKYALPGTKPPLYVAGSFSDPAWQPQEMQYTVKEDEYEFHKDIQVEAGHEYQYKYRVGPGDWWVLNEESPTGMLLSTPHVLSQYCRLPSLAWISNIQY